MLETSHRGHLPFRIGSVSSATGLVLLPLHGRHSGAPEGRTSDVQLHIGESRDSGFDAEPVIGPRFARTRWHRPGMTGVFMSARLG